MLANRPSLALLLLAAGACGLPPAPAVEDPPDALVFAAMGDAPYYWYEQGRYRRVLAELAEADLDLVLHVGDLFWRPCSDEMYARRRVELDALPHPVVYTPGDNEWTDCWRLQPGGYDPLDRLRLIRRVFFDAPRRSLGARPIELERQGGTAPFAEFVENARWRLRGVTFATIHLVGSDNAGEPFRMRTAANDAEVLRRTAAAEAWLRATFAAAGPDAGTIVLALHAELGLHLPATDPFRQPFEPFLETLEREVAAFAGTVVLIHGDFHDFLVDRPLRDRRSGRRLENLTRIQVPGAPHVGWVRIALDPTGSERAAIDAIVQPRWRFW